MEPVKGEQGRDASLDFISRLPEPIIHHIFSFLRARDVACASILSKTWRRFWSTYPYVVFHFIYGNDAMEQDQPPDDLLTRMQKQDFLCLIEKCICERLKQELPVQRFQLYIDFSDLELLSSNMDQWISLAIQRNVAELALSIDCLTVSQRSYYSVPQVAFLATSLTVLSLNGCRFEGSLNVKLPHLQKLSLCHSSFADKFTFNRILSGCPVIEYVKVSFCGWMDTLLSVSGLPYLKYFEFLHSVQVYSIKIDVSNLHTFSFASSLGNGPSSIDLTACKALKELKLNGKSFGINFMLLSQLPALEVLELRNWTDSVGFMISSQRLKKLVFRDCHGLQNVKIDAPNLESFECCNCDEPFIPINALSALQIHLTFTVQGRTVDWLFKLKRFLSKLSNIEDLKIIIYRRSANMIIHEKLSEVGFSYLCHFMCPSSICISSRSYTNLLDELFPLAFPKFIFVMHSCRTLIQLLLEKMEDFRKDPSLLPKLVGFAPFEVDTSGDTTNLFDPATEVFLKAHSTGSFKASAVMLEWKHYVPRGRVTF